MIRYPGWPSFLQLSTQTKVNFLLALFASIRWVYPLLATIAYYTGIIQSISLRGQLSWFHLLSFLTTSLSFIICISVPNPKRYINYQQNYSGSVLSPFPPPPMWIAQKLLLVLFILLLDTFTLAFSEYPHLYAGYYAISLHNELIWSELLPIALSCSIMVLTFVYLCIQICTSLLLLLTCQSIYRAQKWWHIYTTRFQLFKHCFIIGSYNQTIVPTISSYNIMINTRFTFRLAVVWCLFFLHSIFPSYSFPKWVTRWELSGFGLLNYDHAKFATFLSKQYQKQVKLQLEYDATQQQQQQQPKTQTSSQRDQNKDGVSQRRTGVNLQHGQDAFKDVDRPLTLSQTKDEHFDVFFDSGSASVDASEEHTFKSSHDNGLATELDKNSVHENNIADELSNMSETAGLLTSLGSKSVLSDRILDASVYAHNTTTNQSESSIKNVPCVILPPYLVPVMNPYLRWLFTSFTEYVTQWMHSSALFSPPKEGRRSTQPHILAAQ